MMWIGRGTMNLQEMSIAISIGKILHSQMAGEIMKGEKGSKDKEDRAGLGKAQGLETHM